jgi:hypothetical protein
MNLEILQGSAGMAEFCSIKHQLVWLSQASDKLVLAVG